MTPLQKKQIILAAVFLCCLAGIIIVIFPMPFHPIGGPVPVEIRTQRYLNADDRISDDGIHRTVFRKTGTVMSGKPPIFPDLSPHTNSVFHTREGSDDLYLTIVWYFTDRESFLDKKGVLHSLNLERYGNLSITNLTFDYDEPGNSGNSHHRTAIVNVTGFENTITSGYFTTIEYPESKNPDFFILYYGTVKSGNLSRQAPYLKTLMKPFFDPGSIEQITGPV
jgi:hypothetical protein